MKGKPIEPGCLALIVGSSCVPENVGRIVRVVGRPFNGYVPRGAAVRVGSVISDPSIGWIVRTEDPTRKLVLALFDASARRFVGTALSEEILCQQKYLRRIDDGDTTEPRVTETHKPKTEDVF